MKLSIITINLNNVQGLYKTVESVVSQTSRDFEYIIIDGGSTDGSVDIIKSFTPIEPGVCTPLPHPDLIGAMPNASRGNGSTREQGNDLPSGVHQSDLSNSWVANKSAIRNPQSAITPMLHAPSSMPHAPCTMLQAPCPIVFWLSEPDSGIYQAMNKGIRVARGEYCQFLNSGDWLAKPDVIEKMLDNLPDCSFFYGNVLKQFPDGNSYRDTCAKGQVSMLTLYTGSLNHSPVFIKRSLFDRYGLYDENLRIVSDWKWFVITIGLHGEPVRYIDLDVVCFDMNGLSITNPALLNEERRQVLEELIPVNILADYDNFFKNIDSLNRINRNRPVRWLFWFLERLLFKLGK